MEFTKPSNMGFTIYSKSGCNYCNKVKKLLIDKSIPFDLVDCDEYILEDRNNFLLFIKEYTKIDFHTFPMVFNNGIFIGGYNETLNYVNKFFLSFDDNLEF
jgi:glutaredoxin